jgi:hypothetical protein
MAIPKGKVKTLRLRQVKNDLRSGRSGYCGPTVLASITGRRLSVINELIREQRWGTKREAKLNGVRRGGITGTSAGDLRRVLRHYGLDMLRVESYGQGVRPTLATWLKRREPNTLYVVNVGFRRGHWTAVKGRKFLDTFTNGQPVWLKDAPHRKKRVRDVWVVTRAA